MTRQERIYRNKVAHNFNITDIPLEFSLTYGEMAEAFEAWRKKKSLDEIGEELADVAIYLYGIAEILGVDLDKSIDRKMKINEERVYTQENGVLKRK